jgi:hypothetical protein
MGKNCAGDNGRQIFCRQIKMNIETITVIIAALQKFINDNAGLSPKIQLEFITKQTYPAALIKSGAVSTVREYIQGGGVYLLTFYLSYRCQSFGDKEKGFKWLGAVGTFLEQLSLPAMFRQEEFKGMPAVSEMGIGKGLTATRAQIEQTPIDVSGQDKDGVVMYQSVFSLRFTKTGIS